MLYLSTIMYCHLCQRRFATKYTQKRHMTQFHNVTDPKYLGDSEAGVESNAEAEVDSNESKSSGTDSNDSDSASDAEETEEESFWTLLIRETVKNLILDENFTQGETVGELFEGESLTNFIHLMITRLEEIEMVHEASRNDAVMNLIEQKTESLLNEMDDYDNSSEQMRKNAEELAWKKNKVLVKKKIKENIEELEPLIKSEDSTETTLEYQ